MEFTEIILLYQLIVFLKFQEMPLTKISVSGGGGLARRLTEVMTFLAFPARHYRKIHSTNVLERFNKEVKRRTKVVGAFPSEGSVLRLLVPLAVDTNAKWLDRKYVSWENLEHDIEVEEEFTEKF